VLARRAARHGVTAVRPVAASPPVSPLPRFALTNVVAAGALGRGVEPVHAPRHLRRGPPGAAVRVRWVWDGVLNTSKPDLTGSARTVPAVGTFAILVSSLYHFCEPTGLQIYGMNDGQWHRLDNIGA